MGIGKYLVHISGHVDGDSRAMYGLERTWVCLGLLLRCLGRCWIAELQIIRQIEAFSFEFRARGIWTDLWDVG